MKKRLPFILITIFFIAVFVRIFTVYINFDAKPINEKKFNNLLGELGAHLKPYEEFSLKYKFAKVMNIFGELDRDSENLDVQNEENLDLEKQNNKDVFLSSEKFMKNCISLNSHLNKLSEKYLLADENSESSDKKIDESYTPNIEKNNIEFTEKKTLIQESTLQRLKPILTQEDYGRLVSLINAMDENGLYSDTKYIGNIYNILSKYNEIPPQITVNQLRGLYEIKGFYQMTNAGIEKKDMPIILDEITDDEKYKKLVDIETVLLGNIYQDYFDGFFIFTDGEGNKLFDATDFQMSRKGYIGIDYEDFKNGIENDFDKSRFYHSLIRELSKAIITGKNQIDYSKTIPLALDELTTIKEAARKDAYIYQFYNRFWNDTIYFDSMATVNNVEANARKLFYLRHKNDFLNEYASIDPFRDITESMTNFILFEKNVDCSVMGDKIRFFYEFDEIIEIQKKIERNIEVLEGR